MMRRIAAHTVRLAVRSKALPVTCAVVTLLLWVAGWASWGHHRQIQQERAEYNETVRTQWVSQPDRHPHRVSHYGYMAFREQPGLAFFDGGIDSYAGTAVFLEAHRQNPANFSPAGQSPAAIRMGELTPALVLQAIVPLVVFFLGFAAVSEERENGTLALIRAQGAGMGTLLAGKVLGLCAIVASLVVPGLAGLVVTALMTGNWDLRRVLLLALSYGVYLLICALAAVRLSASSATSRSALTALILIWVAGCVILPRALQAWGTAGSPVPSLSQFEALLEADMEKTGDSHNADDPHFAALRARVLAENKVSRVEDLPFNYSAYVMQEGERISSAIFERRYGELIATYKRQAAPLVAGAYVNPYLAVRRLSMALAGTDLDHFIAFQQQAERFRYQMVQKLNEIHLHEIRRESDRTQRVGRERWREFPPFVYHAPPLAEVMREQAGVLAALTGWVAMLAVALWRGRVPC